MLMDLQCLDHVHFSVPDLARAKSTLGPFLRGEFVEDYGGPDMNAYGGWNTSGGDFIEVIDPTLPVFGGSLIPDHGILSVSFRVADIDVGIEQAKAAGLEIRSRIGSEDIGLGKNVIQAQCAPEAVSGLPLELIEHQLPGEYIPLTKAAVDHIEFGVPGDFDAAARALERLFDSAFEPAVDDTTRGLRTRLHRAFGIRLSSPLGDTNASTTADTANPWQPGLRAIGFHCPDLDEATHTANGVGLSLAHEYVLGGVREAEFHPFANMIVRLVERTD